MSSLTQQRLKELLHYDPETGFFTWRVTTGARSQAGSRAGTYKKGVRSQIRVDGKIYRNHRLAFLYMLGRWPEDQVDHRDGDQSNNAWTNLREVNNQENSKNTSLRTNNRVGLTGVCIDSSKKSPRWCAYIKAGKKIHLGAFDNLLDAAAARKSAELKYDFYENHGRSK